MLLLLLPLLWAAEWTWGQRPWVPHPPDLHFPHGYWPGGPSYRLHVPESVTVQEGLCILVPCSLPRQPFYPPTGSGFSYWFRAGADRVHDSPVATNNPDRPVQEETRGRFHLLEDPWNNCSLDIRDAQRDDTGSYFFRVEKGRFKWNYLENQVFVNVTALNHTPDILFSGTLESGHSSNLTCSVPWACERGTPPIFSWMSGALTSLGPRTRDSSMLTLTPRPQDHGTNLICQVTLPGANVTSRRTVRLNISYTPQDLTVTVSRGAGPGKSVAATQQVVVVAIGVVAAVKILLLSLCLIFLRVRSRRRKAARPAAGRECAHAVTVPPSARASRTCFQM